MKDIKALGELLVSLSIAEAKDLALYLKETYGIEQALPVHVSNSISTVNQDLPTKTNFDVFLKSTGANKLQVVKLVKDLTGFGLKEAKQLCDEAPQVIKEGLLKSEAENFKTQLLNAGADVEIR